MSRLTSFNGVLHRSASRKHPKGQRGAVLIFALIVLLVMTVLAISGVGNSTLEQRMAGNYSQSMTAFQTAEQGLRVAEEWMTNKLLNDPVFSALDDAGWWFQVTGTTDGLYSSMNSDPDNAKVCRGNDDCEFDPRDESQWCNDVNDVGCRLPKGYITLGETLHSVALPTVGVDFDGDGTIDSVANQPRFIIEYIGPKSDDARSITLGKPSFGSGLQAFRITVIAWGQDAAARQVLQGHVLLPL